MLLPVLMVISHWVPEIIPSITRPSLGRVLFCKHKKGQNPMNPASSRFLTALQRLGDWLRLECKLVPLVVCNFDGCGQASHISSFTSSSSFHSFVGRRLGVILPWEIPPWLQSVLSHSLLSFSKPSNYPGQSKLVSSVSALRSGFIFLRPFYTSNSSGSLASLLKGVKL